MRRAIGAEQLEWTGDAPDAKALWQALVAQYPELKPLGASRTVAVNRRHVPADHPLRSGDEVAFFPPVSGG